MRNLPVTHPEIKNVSRSLVPTMELPFHDTSGPFWMACVLVDVQRLLQ